MSVHVTTEATVVSETGVLSLARIGYHNPARDGDIAASTEAEGFAALGAQNDNTYEYWKPTAVPATWRVDLGSAMAINYCGIAAHELANDTNASVKVQSSSDDSAWTDRSDVFYPSDNSPMLLLFPAATARYWRIYVDGALEAIGHIRFGSILTMQRGIYRGLTPPTMGDQTMIRPTMSEGGQFLGRTSIRHGYAGSHQWQRLEPDWLRTYFIPFKDDAKQHPFIFAWRPDDYPNEVVYAETTGDMQLVNTGPRGLMSANIQWKGHGPA